ncbi:hypothetical protein BP6252_11312 [Coleophoma cylindrospora]|uniref:Heterokaryon incompatibility domain-containing protein n=1 Tax=Coleophoma cylindrospora TaxID=1849047 RepID=A0A3D8QPQ8_9HELO|nr:hypothetical protein BP6252_11312 [Coleophoma cylindrospora]
MRVINTRTQQYNDLPRGEKYAILSHTWETDEVTFQDLHTPATARQKTGFQKIEGFCKKALQDGYSYGWADTCCINNESSAELGEAINSMYKWYQDADVCYALLTDVDTTSTSVCPLEEQLAKSRWFTRGWTLQELLAPKTVIFFDNNWNILGTKATMTEVLARLTRIDGAVLSGDAPLSQRSIAQRMSWAARRTTTRVEDIAYCLLGIFDVNMPMIYGEGEKAFIRLQLQILEQSDDHSIFAWPIDGTGKQGMLADSPAAFRGTAGIGSLYSRRGRPSYRMTNRGLSLELPAVPFAVDTYLAQLDCCNALNGPSSRAGLALGIFLRRLDEDDQYARVEYNGMTFRTISQYIDRPRIKFNIRQREDRAMLRNQKDSFNGFCVDGDFLPPSPQKLGYPPNMFIWEKHTRRMIAEAREGFGDVGYLAVNLGQIRVIKLGFDAQFNPVCFLAAKAGLSNQVVGYLNPKQNLFMLTEGLQPTEEGNIQKYGILERHASDMVGWSKVLNDRAHALEYHQGLWAVKGDRLHGIDVVLENPRSTLSQKLFHLQITREYLDNGKEWRVSLELL